MVILLLWYTEAADPLGRIGPSEFEPFWWGFLKGMVKRASRRRGCWPKLAALRTNYDVLG
jgi:hypothetical protein